MVSLVEQGWADQNDVARAFGCSERTVRRHQRRFEEGGLAALVGQRHGYPEVWHRVPMGGRRLVERLKSDGHSNREIARRLGISDRAVRKLLRRLGWKEPAVAAVPELALELPQAANPKLSAFSASGAERLPHSLEKNCGLPSGE